MQFRARKETRNRIMPSRLKRANKSININKPDRVGFYQRDIKRIFNGLRIGEQVNAILAAPTRPGINALPIIRLPAGFLQKKLMSARNLPGTMSPAFLLYISRDHYVNAFKNVK